MCSSCEKIFNIDATETESIVFMSMAYHDNKYIIFEVIETNVVYFSLGVNNTFVVDHLPIISDTAPISYVCRINLIILPVVKLGLVESYLMT